MLDSMRGSGNSKVMWVIMGLLMLGLTGFGIGQSGGAFSLSNSRCGVTLYPPLTSAATIAAS